MYLSNIKIYVVYSTEAMTFVCAFVPAVYKICVVHFALELPGT
jgi:hypothetical protein